MKQRSKPHMSGLKPEIERTRKAPAVDAVDSDVGSYIDAFLRGLPEAVAMEEFSLETPEQAKKALVVINATLERLNQQVANARALQRLVTTKSDD